MGCCIKYKQAQAPRSRVVGMRRFRRFSRCGAGGAQKLPQKIEASCRRETDMRMGTPWPGCRMGYGQAEKRMEVVAAVNVDSSGIGGVCLAPRPLVNKLQPRLQLGRCTMTPALLSIFFCTDIPARQDLFGDRECYCMLLFSCPLVPASSITRCFHRTVAT